MTITEIKNPTIIETFKSGGLWDKVVYTETDLTTVQPKDSVLLMKARQNHMRPNQVIRIEKCGFVKASDLLAKLTNQPYLVPEFPQTDDIEKILLQTSVNKNKETVSLYMIPLENKHTEKVGAFLFQKTGEITEFKGSLSVEHTQALKTVLLSPNHTQASDKPTKIIPDTTLPFTNCQYVPTKETQQKQERLTTIQLINLQQKALLSR